MFSKLKYLIALILNCFFLLPKKYEVRLNKIRLKNKFLKDFSKRKLKYHDDGYYYLNPMPSKEFLDDCYKNVYETYTFISKVSWRDIDQNIKRNLLIERDLDHYKNLLTNYPDFNKSSKKILNFGSGQGGISFLLHQYNHIIYNLDPGASKKYFEQRWHNIDSLDKIAFKFDLIYASHSIEHVADISELMRKFSEFADSNTIFFIEVPNCSIPEKQFISFPHTYYFTTNFFKQSFKKCIFLKTYTNKIDGGISEFSNNSGLNGLRFIGQELIKDKFI